MLLQRVKGATMPQLLSHPTATTAKEQWRWKFANNLTGGSRTMSYTLLGEESDSWVCGRCSLSWRKSDGSKRDLDSWQSNLTVARQWSKPTILRKLMWMNGRIHRQSLSV